MKSYSVTLHNLSVFEKKNIMLKSYYLIVPDVWDCYNLIKCLASYLTIAWTILGIDILSWRRIVSLLPRHYVSISDVAGV